MMEETDIDPASLTEKAGASHTRHQGEGPVSRSQDTVGLTDRGAGSHEATLPLDDPAATEASHAMTGARSAPTEQFESPRPDNVETVAFEPGPETVEYSPPDPDSGIATKSISPEGTDVWLPSAVIPPRQKRPAGKLPDVPGYEILGILGRGGMGIVYKARHLKLGRIDALKMILAGAGARPDDLQRFEAEAQAVAQIVHPNIIQIHTVGEFEGMPYCSLEYLSGGSLSQKIHGKPQPVGEAALMVETLAGAMYKAHTHEHAVVHRDLKPANVLLSTDGVPKITDFGLVKRLEGDSGQTRSGSILGTPSYMAPEQALGEARSVGPASDQYALGAILYEMLTGRPPFQGASILDTLDMVRHREPVPPSDLQPKIPRDLETICLKCLQKEIARRYKDCAALAEDLRRFRTDSPILARPVSAPERLYRWCRRNPRVAGLTAAVALLLLAVSIGASAFAATLSTKNTELTKARDTAKSKQLLAEENERREHAAIVIANAQNGVAVETVDQFIDLLENRLRDEPKLRDVRKTVLENAVKNLEATAAAMIAFRNSARWDAPNEERNLRKLARAHQRMGETYLSLENLDQALNHFRKANDLVEYLAPEHSTDIGAKVRLARAQRNLGYLYMDRLGDSGAALKCLGRAVTIDRECLGSSPQSDDLKLELANSLGISAGVEMSLGHLGEAQILYREELKLRNSLTPATARAVIVRRELSGLYEKLAEWNLKAGLIDKANVCYDRCRKIREEVWREVPKSWPVVYDLARSYNNEAMLRYPQGNDPAGARALHAKAVALILARVEEDPGDSLVLRSFSETLYYEATCALKLGDATAASEGFRRCLEIRREAAKKSSDRMVQINYMVALARCHEQDEAVKIADALVASDPRNEQIYFQASCGYALASGAAADSSDEVHAAEYASKAIDALRRAKARGWTDEASLKTDPDLEPIRKNPAFLDLLNEFKTQSGPSPKVP